MRSNNTPQTKLDFKNPNPRDKRFDNTVWWFEFVPVLTMSADGRDICASQIEISINLTHLPPLLTAWELDDALEREFGINQFKRVLQKMDRWQEFLQEVERLGFAVSYKCHGPEWISHFTSHAQYSLPKAQERVRRFIHLMYKK